jgi:hypothetical protein
MRQRRSPEQWQTLGNLQRDSGLSAMQFCKQENIGYASFSTGASACPIRQPVTQWIPVKPVFWICPR